MKASETTSVAIDIYSYTNYRNFLQDYFLEAKRVMPERFSFRFFSKHAGFGSSNFLHLVINGKRNLSYESVQKIAKVLKLNRRQTLFLENLVHFNQSKSFDEKTRSFEKMISFREYREAQKLVKEQYDYLSRWYYPVIREMVNLPQFKEDPTWIAKKVGPPMTPEKAKEALIQLQTLQLLARNSQGKLIQPHHNLVTDPAISSVSVVHFHRQMIEKGRESISHPSSTREISALTMSLSKKQFETVRKKIQELHQEVQGMIAENVSEKADRVCQLNFQLFTFIGGKNG